MSDWADEIALKLHGFSKQFDAGWPVEWLGVIKPTAAALRKARADGMKLAAEHCSDPDYAPTADRWELANCLDSLADKIEKGET